MKPPAATQVLMTRITAERCARFAESLRLEQAIK